MTADAHCIFSMLLCLTVFCQFYLKQSLHIRSQKFLNQITEHTLHMQCHRPDPACSSPQLHPNTHRCLHQNLHIMHTQTSNSRTAFMPQCSAVDLLYHWFDVYVGYAVYCCILLFFCSFFVLLYANKRIHKLTYQLTYNESTTEYG